MRAEICWTPSRISASPVRLCSTAASPEREISSARPIASSTELAFCSVSVEVCLISCAVVCVCWIAAAWRESVLLCSSLELVRATTEVSSRWDVVWRLPSASRSFTTIAAKAAESCPISSSEESERFWRRSPFCTTACAARVSSWTGRRIRRVRRVTPIAKSARVMALPTTTNRNPCCMFSWSECVV